MKYSLQGRTGSVQPENIHTGNFFSRNTFRAILYEALPRFVELYFGEVFRGDVASTVQDANQLNTSFNGARENQVAPDWKTTEFWREFLNFTAHDLYSDLLRRSCRRDERDPAHERCASPPAAGPDSQNPYETGGIKYKVLDTYA